MLEPQDIKIIEESLDRVVEKRLDVFEVVVDQKIDDLATMIKSGFDDVDKRFDDVDKRFDQVDKRFDRLENLILTDHRHRLEYLELEIQRMKDMFAFK